MEISSLTKEYIRCEVSAKEDGSPVDPTADTVHFAFKTEGPPSGGDWVAGSWETDGAKYFARCLVGPGAKVLDPASYWVWLKFTDNPEVPVRPVGLLTVS